MPETITIKKKEFEHIRKSLSDSIELIEEIEFREGVNKGREEFESGKFTSLDGYNKKHKK
jgi:hypothetical protein